jgi:hypothetical protein
MILPVGLLHPKEKGLHLANGVFLDRSRHLLDGPNWHWFALPEESRDIPNEANCAMGLPLFLQNCLQILNALVGMTEPGGIQGLLLF